MEKVAFQYILLKFIENRMIFKYKASGKYGKILFGY